mmetsp:Transcript_14988/g.35785  ORF Transcript_14988/g.35785 Transcript_14988/m.35785 type:complete len:224 (-) Transcript_14988:324-995(-)
MSGIAPTPKKRYDLVLVAAQFGQRVAQEGKSRHFSPRHVGNWQRIIAVGPRCLLGRPFVRLCHNNTRNQLEKVSRQRLAKRHREFGKKTDSVAMLCLRLVLRCRRIRVATTEDKGIDGVLQSIQRGERGIVHLALKGPESIFEGRNEVPHSDDIDVVLARERWKRALIGINHRSIAQGLRFLAALYSVGSNNLGGAASPGEFLAHILRHGFDDLLALPSGLFD